MYKILPIFSVITLVGCGNPKEEIVNQIRLAKDSVHRLDLAITNAETDLKEVHLGDRKPITPNDSTAVVALDLALAAAPIIDQFGLYQLRKDQLKKIDSLQLELKKY